jgi:hypothetical protein
MLLKKKNLKLCYCAMWPSRGMGPRPISLGRNWAWAGKLTSHLGQKKPVPSQPLDPIRRPSALRDGTKPAAGLYP